LRGLLRDWLVEHCPHYWPDGWWQKAENDAQPTRQYTPEEQVHDGVDLPDLQDLLNSSSPVVVQLGDEYIPLEASDEDGDESHLAYGLQRPLRDYNMGAMAVQHLVYKEIPPDEPLSDVWADHREIPSSPLGRKPWQWPYPAKELMRATQ
jgi:hypothetical protein